jgi:hypothetical protein
VGTPDTLIACQMGQKSNGLDGLSRSGSANVERKKGEQHTQAPFHLQGCN